MADLQSLLQQIAALDGQRDFDGLRRVREQLVAEFPDSDNAVEALYKIGLDLLFRQRKLEAAIEKFDDAAKRKQPFWAAAARTSLGLCYYHQRRMQKALFELRKVAYAKSANVHSVTALAFIENIFEAEGQTSEAQRVRKDRIVQLEQLIAQSRTDNGNPQERGYHLFQLAIALRDQHDNDRAGAMLREARDLGKEILGADLYQSVTEALHHP